MKNHQNNKSLTHPTSDSVTTDFSFFFFFFPTSLFSVTFWEAELPSSVLTCVFFKVLSSSCAIWCWYSRSSLSSASFIWLSAVASVSPLLFPFLLFRFGAFVSPTSSGSKAISDLEASTSPSVKAVTSSDTGREGSSLLLFLLPFDCWTTSWFLLLLTFSATSLSLRLFLVKRRLPCSGLYVFWRIVSSSSVSFSRLRSFLRVWS